MSISSGEMNGRSQQWFGDEAGAGNVALITGSGSSVELIAGQLYMDDPAVAWARLQDLHRRALGEDGPFRFDSTGELSPEQAFDSYSHSLFTALGQIAVTGPEASNALLGSLASHALSAGSLDGLESLFLSGASGAYRTGTVSEEMSRASRVWDQFGAPVELGGGVAYAPCVDVGKGRVTYATRDEIIEAVAKAAGEIGGPTGEQLARGAIGLVERPSTGHGGGATGGADFAHDLVELGKGLLQVGAAIVGSAVGGLIGGLGGPLGATAGAGYGAVAAVAGVKELLGDSDKHGKDQNHKASPDKASDVAKGIAVVTQATATKSPSPGSPEPASSEEKKCIKPFHQLPADDGGGGDFEPNWLPSILAEGAGLDQLVNFDSAQTVLLSTLPTLDDHSLVHSAGFIPAFADVLAAQQRLVNYVTSGEELVVVESSDPNRLVVAEPGLNQVGRFELMVPAVWWEFIQSVGRGLPAVPDDEPIVKTVPVDVAIEVVRQRLVENNTSRELPVFDALEQLKPPP